MNAEEAAKIIWDAMQTGTHNPESLRGKLKLEEANAIQLKVLDHWIASGEKHAGWKIGMTAAPLRQAFKIEAPIYGYLLESRQFSSGHTFQYEEIHNPAIEAELYFVMGKRLAGPKATKEQALQAIELIAPAFEVVSLRVNLAEDTPLAVADNIAQWGYVVGDVIKPYPQDLNLGEVVADVKNNDTDFFRGRGADVIDNQLQSIAWLANQLAQHGHALEAGHRVMSGSFIKPTPFNKGDRWETHFSSIGTVSANFL